MKTGEWSKLQRSRSTSRNPRRSGLSDAACETFRQKFSKRTRAPSAPPLAGPIDQHGAIHRAGRGARDAVDLQPGFLQQPIKSTPGKSAVRAAALQCEIDEDDTAAGAVGFSGWGRHDPSGIGNRGLGLRWTPR